MPHGERSGASSRLREHGLKPRKRLGQNFLRDRTFLPKIIAAAGVRPEDEVLEVGAGTGILTHSLAESAERVIAIELDDNLFSLLEREFGDQKNVRLLHANALDVDPGALFSQPYKLVANIPYYITGPLLRHFLESHRPPSLTVLMVQRDVAERIAAASGHLSLLGVSVQYYATPEIIAHVPAAAFYPPPKVESAILRLTPHETRRPEEARETFFTVVRAGFSVRRKQMVNALQNGLGLTRLEVNGLLKLAEIDGVRRAETLTIEEWSRLAGQYGESRIDPR